MATEGGDNGTGQSFDGGIILDTPDEIAFARLAALKGALKLEMAGIRMVIYANQGLRAAVRAMQDTYAELLRSGHSLHVEPRIATVRELFGLLGMNAEEGEPQGHVLEMRGRARGRSRKR